MKKELDVLVPALLVYIVAFIGFKNINFEKAIVGT